jgi:phospholipid/cholesterol/gamma-HCH transport system permease protein
MLSALLVSTSHLEFLVEVGSAFTPHLLLIFVLKNLVFGYVIGATSCYNGLRVRTSPTEVPQQATRAIVNSLIFIFVIEGLFALAMF